MALQRQVVDIPIGAGMAEKIDPIMLQPGQGDATLENARFDDFGRICKRYGYTYAVAPGTVLHSLIEHAGGALELQRDGDLYRYHASRVTKWEQRSYLGGGAGSEVHPCTPIEIQRDPVAVDTDGVVSASVVQYSTMVIQAWVTNRITNPPLHWRIVDNNQVVISQGEQAVATAHGAWEQVWVVAASSNVVIVARNANHFYFWVSSFASGWNGTWNESTAELSGCTDADVCVDASNSKLHIAWVDGANLYLQRYAITSTAITADQNATHVWAVDKPRCCWHATNSRLWVQGEVSTDVRYAVYGSDYTQYKAPAAHAGLDGALGDHSLIASETGEAWSCWEDPGGGAGSYCARLRCMRLSDGSAGSQSYICTANRCYLAARIAYEDDLSRPIIPAWYSPSGTLQGQGWLLSPYNYAYNSGAADLRMAVLARFGVDHAYHLSAHKAGQTVSGTERSTEPVEAYHYLFPALALGATAGVCGFEMYHIKGTVRPVRTVYRDGVTYWSSGGMLWSYDGSDAGEACPHLYPEYVEVALSSGGALEAGAYSWRALYEWEDAQGNLRRSAPCAAVSATASATQKATVSIADVPCTAYDPGATHGMRVAVYRTKVGGTTYYRCGTVDCCWGANDGETDDYVDTLADSALGAVLYTEGGVLEASHLPPALDVLIHKDRMWIINAERRQEVYYSKLLEETVGPEFNAALTMRLPEGEATALSRIGDSVVIFAETAIYVVQGDGPNNLGEQDTFARPQRIVSDVGCIDRNSVVDTPLGIMFRSKRGLELLTPGFALAPFEQFGGAVQDSLSTEAVMTAVLVPKRGEVRISFRPVPDYPVLVFNYIHRKWALWTGHTAIRDARLIAGVYHWVANDGDLYAENSAYADNVGGSATHITLKVVTPWIKLAGLQGFKRLSRAAIIGAALDASTLTIRIMRDYDSTVVQTETITFTGAESPAQRKILLTIQKLEAVQFDIRDGAASGYASGFQPVSLALDVAAKRGLHRLPSTKVT